MADIVPNEDYPNVGGVTILDYNDKLHFVLNARVVEEGIWVDHTNYGGPGYYHTFFSWQYLKEHRAEYYRPRGD